MSVLWSMVAVLAAIWFAGDAVLGLLVAPQLFQYARAEHVPDAFAGMVFGESLARWVVVAGIGCVIPIVCLLAAASGRALKLVGWRKAMLPAILAMVILSMHAASVIVVRQGQEAAAGLRADPDPQRIEAFRIGFHARSKLVFGTEMLLSLSLTVGAILAVRQTARKPI